MDELTQVAEAYSVLDNVPVGVCILRKDYQVLYWNKTLEEWTGVSKLEVVGFDLGKHFSNLKEKKYTGRFDTVFEGGPPAVFSSQFHKYIFPAQLPGGKFRVQNTTTHSVPSVDGQGLYAFVTVQDVTQLSERIQAYQKMRDRALEQVKIRQRAELALRSAMKQLESFSYSVSHDLRAPLRAIQGFSEIIARRYRASLSEEGSHYLDNIIEASGRMEQLIDDMLAYSRLGKPPKDAAREPLPKVIAGVIKALKPQFDSTGGELNVVEGIPDIPVFSTIVEPILNNLIGNALTYRSPDAPPHVSVASYIEGGQLILRVKDNGIGIPRERWDIIFNVFQRLHGDDYPGTGIGLAIVKKCVELLDGEVWLNSSEGNGSTFYVRFPVSGGHGRRADSVSAGKGKDADTLNVIGGE